MLTEQEMHTIREAVGIFHRSEDLQGAIDELLSSGFHRAELGLLASGSAVRDRGGLLLWVRTPDAPDEHRAVDILKRHSGSEVHVHALPVQAADPTVS